MRARLAEKVKDFKCLVHKYYDFKEWIFCAFRFSVHLVLTLSEPKKQTLQNRNIPKQGTENLLFSINHLKWSYHYVIKFSAKDGPNLWKTSRRIYQQLLYHVSYVKLF